MKIITKDLPKCEECPIREASLFGELENIHLDKARSLRSSQVKLSAGDFLYHEGDIPDKAYTLHQGWVILFKNLKEGSRQILRFGLAGDLLCFTSKNKSLDHSAVALTDITLCAFPLSGFRSIISELPELSIAISSTNAVTTKRCYATLTTIASHNAETKVAYLLLSLYIRASALPENKSSDYVFFPITQEDIGDALGLTSIHVNRIYQNLRKKGLIECNNKSLLILDEDELAEVAKVDLEELKRLMIVV